MKAKGSKYWTAFYTKPRNEKKVAERLAIKGYEVYCPVRTVLKQWSDRKKKIKEVLFTSYLFAKITEGERIAILQDQGVVSSVFWLKEPVRIPEVEINSIKEFLNDHPNAAVSNQIIVGNQLDIKSGPLRGEKGIVQKVKGHKVILTLDMLGVTLSAELSASQLA